MSNFGLLLFFTVSVKVIIRIKKYDPNRKLGQIN